MHLVSINSPQFIFKENPGTLLGIPTSLRSDSICRFKRSKLSVRSLRTSESGRVGFTGHRIAEVKHVKRLSPTSFAMGFCPTNFPHTSSFSFIFILQSCICIPHTRNFFPNSSLKLHLPQEHHFHSSGHSMSRGSCTGDDWQMVQVYMSHGAVSGFQTCCIS